MHMRIKRVFSGVVLGEISVLNCNVRFESNCAFSFTFCRSFANSWYMTFVFGVFISDIASDFKN
jgi:hypothetical protein